MTITLLNHVGRTWGGVIGGFIDCAAAYTMGVLGTSGTVRILTET